MKSSILGLLGTLVLQSPAFADMVSVDAYSYPDDSGPVSFAVHSGIAPSVEQLARLRAAKDGVTEVEIYCAATPGPRFMQIDGHFYTLNGKSRRAGAFVETSAGRLPVTDSLENAKEFSDDFGLLSELASYAEHAC